MCSNFPQQQLDITTLDYTNSTKYLSFVLKVQIQSVTLEPGSYTQDESRLVCVLLLYDWARYHSSEMNHSLILPHLIRFQGEPKSDWQKSRRGKELYRMLLNHQALMKSSGAHTSSLSVLNMNITPFNRFIFYMHHSTQSHLEQRNLPLEKKTTKKHLF